MNEEAGIIDLQEQQCWINRYKTQIDYIRLQLEPEPTAQNVGHKYSCDMLKNSCDLLPGWVPSFT